MHISRTVLLSRIPETARVLDLGGWERVFPRANVVVDLSPYETRKQRPDEGSERFTRDDWIIADFCSADFWQRIPDKGFDFITIGHTLEDIRDPLYVCQQMIRCSRAGYMEAPSKFLECSKDSATDACAGYSHHRWIIEPMPDLTGLIFKAKLHWAHVGDYLGDERRHMRRDYAHRFDGYFWKGSFRYVEHFPKGPVHESEDLKWYFANVVQPGGKRLNHIDLVPDSSSSQDGRCLWVNEYELPYQHEKRTGQRPPLYPQYVTPS